MTRTKRALKAAVGGLLLLCCGIAWAGPADDAAVWPPEPMRRLPGDYLDRLRASIGATGGRMDRLTFDTSTGKDSIGWVRYGFSGLLLGERVEEINRFFESDKFEFSSNPKFGFSLFGVSYMRLYGVLNSRTGVLKGRLSPAAQANFERGMWLVAKANSKLAEARRGVWDMEGTENHHLSSKTCDLLAAQFLRHVPEYADQRYDDGSTLAEQYEARRDYFLQWFDERAKRGQFVEAGAPSYQPDCINSIFNLRDFAEDPILRKKADMYLDLSYANIAEETLLTTRGGPKTFKATGHEYDAGFSDRSYNVLFDAPGRTFEPLADTTRGTSDYYPPPVISSLARDTGGRGVYSFIKRWPGPVCSNERAAPGADRKGQSLWRTLDPQRSVLRYGFATPDYVIGSAGLDPEWLDDASMGFRWQGVVFASNVLARIGFEVKPASKKNWHAFNPFISVQDRNVMVTQKWAPAPPNPPSVNPAYLRVYFSPTLDLVQEESGWIFSRAGNAFAAVRVVSGGYAWTPAWKHDESVTKDNTSFITLDSEDAPVITVVNQASDYDGDFETFKAAIKAQPVHFAEGILEFATIRFSGVARPPEVDGKPVDLAPGRGYDSPFIRSNWNSGLIYIRKGNETEILDFRDPRNPVKTVGAPVTDAFPPGVGSARPIVFGKR